MAGRRVCLSSRSSRFFGLVFLLCLFHILKRDKQDYSITSEYSGLRFPHSTLVKVANWDLDLYTIHTTKWRTHVYVTNRIKRASATTVYYDNSTSAFRPIIQLLHDVELNPGPVNCSTSNEFVKSAYIFYNFTLF